MLTIQDFINTYNGKTKGYPTDSSYAGECLSIVKLWMKARYGFNPPASGTNSAYGYWSNFPAPLSDYYEKIENTPDLTPQLEWIPIWSTKTGNGYGHIEIVCDDTATKQYFTSFGQNWNGRQAHLTKHNYTNVVGFLKPKGNAMPDQYGDMVWKSTQHDETTKSIFGGDADPRQTSSTEIMATVNGYKSSSTDMRNKLAVAETEAKNRTEQVSRLKDQLLDEQNLRKTESAALIEANKTIVKLRGDYDGRITSLQAMVDGLAAQKGTLQTTLATLEAENRELKKGIKAHFTLWEWLVFPLPWMIGVLKTIKIGGNS